MGRGSDQATTGATTAQQNSNTLMGQGSNIYASLAPQLLTEAAHPAGFSPTDISAMDTAGQQSSGGAVSGAVGQGALLASRTKNAGGPQAAIAESVRRAGQNLGEEAVGTRVKNAALKEDQRQGGISGLEGLFGTTTGQSNAALGQIAPNVNANTQAKSQSWDWAKYTLDPALAAAGNSAKFGS